MPSGAIANLVSIVALAGMPGLGGNRGHLPRLDVRTVASELPANPKALELQFGAM